MLFEIIPDESFFVEFKGDLSKLNEVIINVYVEDEKLQNELTDLIYDKEGKFKIKKLKSPTKDWDIFIKCGFLL